MSSFPLFSRRGRRRGGSKTGRLRWGLIAGLSFVAISVAFSLWAASEQGRWFLADRGVAPARGWASDELGEVIRAALLTAGVDPDSLIMTAPDLAQRTTIRAQSSLGFVPLNLAITEAVQAAHGRVHRGRLFPGRDGATLELEIGMRRHVTHRVLLLRGPRPVEPPVPPRGRLALVIDDWGHNLSEPARRILALSAPITIAILPELPFSTRILTEAQRSGKRTILHLPMQPQEGSDVGPGKAFIQVAMSAQEIRDLTARFLDGLPGVAGVNNHMGSLATQSRDVVRPVLELLAERGLYFLDSYTTPRSVAYKVAADLGIPSARNDLFLDVDTDDAELVEQRLWKLVGRARRKGHAIGIGHVNPATATALEKVLAQLDPSDVAIVHLDELVHLLPQ